MPVDKPIILNQEEDNKRFVDEQTDKRNYEHLTDESDKITEEDIKNVKTNVQTTPAEEIGEGTEEISTEVDDKLIGDDLTERHLKDGTDPEIDTAWNILGK